MKSAGKVLFKLTNGQNGDGLTALKQTSSRCHAAIILAPLRRCTNDERLPVLAGTHRLQYPLLCTFYAGG